MTPRPLLTVLLCLLLVSWPAPTQSGEYDAAGGNATSNAEHNGIEVAGFEIEEIRFHITVLLILLAVVAVKMSYSRFELLAAYIPESCCLILIGVITGAVLRFGLAIRANADVWELTPSLFLYILLPPIVFEASTHLCCREFLDVFFPVLVYAVVGTILNFLLIGVLLYYTAVGGAMGPGAPNVTQSDCFLFSSVIVAVDPVAVLAIFEEIHVNKVLYFYVFGESLFNDAVTIVLYNMMASFMLIETPGAKDIGLGIVSFFTISVGGALIGIVFGAVSALVTRLTRRNQTIEPVVILAFGYLSYLVGDLVKWSGIISMICCAMVQSTYAFRNMSSKSVMVTRKSIKIIATFCEAIIFIDLGVALVRIEHSWHTGFSLWALVYTVTVRMAATCIQSIILNKTGMLLKKISLTEQFVMGYGGLRGAVAFTLVNLIGPKVLAKSAVTKELYLTTTLAIIIFTILVMGLTIKPLVKFFHVKLQKEAGLSVSTELGETVCDHFSAGMEAIEGHTGRNVFRERVERFDMRVIRRLLQNDPETYDEKIVKIYEKVALAIHYATIKASNESWHYLDKLSPSKLRTNLATSVTQSSNLSSSGDVPKVPGVQTMLDMTGDFLHSGDEFGLKATATYTPLSKTEEDQDLSMLMRRRRSVAQAHRGFHFDFHDLFRRSLAHRSRVAGNRDQHKPSKRVGPRADPQQASPGIPEVAFSLEDEEDGEQETTKM